MRTSMGFLMIYVFFSGTSHVKLSSPMVGRIRNLFFEQDWLVKSMDGTVLVGEWSEWVIFLGDDDG